MSDDLDYLAERLSQILATGDVTGAEREFIEDVIESGWMEPDYEYTLDARLYDEEKALQLDQIRRAKQIIQNH